MPSTTARSVDLLIVGAGPVGLFGAYYAGVRRLTTLVIDSPEEPGGQITAMFPEKSIVDVAGFVSIRGRDLVENLLKQAAQHKIEYLLGEQASGMTQIQGGFTVTTDKGTVVETRAIVRTGGIGTFTPRPLPAGGEYLGRGLVHFVRDPSTCLGEDVVIVGGGDSAVDWALLLEPIAKSVTLVHRRAEFRAHPYSVEQLKVSSVRIITEARVTAVRGAMVVEEVHVSTPHGIETLPATKIVAALGFTANLGPLQEWGLSMSRRSVSVDSSGATNIPGIYAAGDIVDYPGKVKLIVSVSAKSPPRSTTSRHSSTPACRPSPATSPTTYRQRQDPDRQGRAHPGVHRRRRAGGRGGSCRRRERRRPGRRARRRLVT